MRSFLTKTRTTTIFIFFLLLLETVTVFAEGNNEAANISSLDNPWIQASSDYFKVIDNNADVVINQNGQLVKVAELTRGEVYPIARDYGNWHEIKFGNDSGYVYKANTVPASGDTVKNQNRTYLNTNQYFIAERKAIVYDNTSGKLIPFAMIEEGKRYPIVSDYGNWYRVIIAGRIGYINKNDVNGYFNNESRYFEVTEENLTVFDNRGGSLKEIGTLKKGQVYTRISDYGNWHRIQFGSNYGYVYEDGTIPSFQNSIKSENQTYKNSLSTFTTKEDTIVYDNSTSQLTAFFTIKKGTTYPIVSDYGNWYRIIVGGRIGYVQKNNVIEQFTNDTKYFKVTEENLAIFDNRGKGLEQVGTLKAGQVYPRVSDYGNWHRIRFGDHYGYVYKKGTIPDDGNSIKNVSMNHSSIGILKALNNITIYDNTGKDLIPFGVIEQGQNYPVTRDYGNWYEVNISGRYGYVRKSNVEAKVAKNIVNPNQVYTYEQMEKDISELEETYPELITTKIIGQSVDGRNLYAIKVGKGNTEIFFNGAHHAREWLTTNLLMEMIDSYSQSYVMDETIEGYDPRYILNNASIWFVPMVNPDGVSLVQKGAYSAQSPQQVISMNGGSTDFSAWKANIRGVDLNRQYPAGWSTIQNNTGRPSPQNFKGLLPLSEPESKAMYDFTLAHDFKTAVAYHSSGEILYWDYKTSGALQQTSKKIAEMINQKTGYRLIFPGSNPSGGGYTDWFLYGMQKPGFTPEISPAVGPRPVPLSSFGSIWGENKSVGLMLGLEAYQNSNR
ncbi:M14 family metallocarboxypeptidase [Terrihalobacillus insolitus]|uniref:M14 family metallocarboxypeptidase n=1 Tax=Terrihalobacillus insolitus TaxID=2950438 RepID=UPI00234191E0|nr:M14 family metallocarboxypeptidase [Terrihalobacillus insolitus]MDC3411831.1 M14 family metallocarboxypeptidase [Terrihalobacillus insolitus]